MFIFEVDNSMHNRFCLAIRKNNRSFFTLKQTIYNIHNIVHFKIKLRNFHIWSTIINFVNITKQIKNIFTPCRRDQINKIRWSLSPKRFDDIFDWITLYQQFFTCKAISAPLECLKLFVYNDPQKMKALRIITVIVYKHNSVKSY